MWDTVVESATHLSHDLPCPRCAHAGHHFLPCDQCDCRGRGVFNEDATEPRQVA